MTIMWFSNSKMIGNMPLKSLKYVLTIRILDRQSERIIKFTRKIGKGLVTADRDKSFAFFISVPTACDLCTP